MQIQTSWSFLVPLLAAQLAAAGKQCTPRIRASDVTNTITYSAASVAYTVPTTTTNTFPTVDTSTSAEVSTNENEASSETSVAQTSSVETSSAGTSSIETSSTETPPTQTLSTETSSTGTSSTEISLIETSSVSILSTETSLTETSSIAESSSTDAASVITTTTESTTDSATSSSTTAPETPTTTSFDTTTTSTSSSILTTSSTAALPCGTNLIVNPGFEDGGPPWELYNAVPVSGGGLEYDGLIAGYAFLDSDNPDASFTQTISNLRTDGTAYKIGLYYALGYVQGFNFQTTCILQIKFNGVELGADVPITQGPAASYTYAERTVTPTAASGDLEIYVSCTQSDGIVVLVDDTSMINPCVVADTTTY